MSENTGSLITLNDVKALAEQQRGKGLSAEKITIDFSQIELVDGYSDKADIDFAKILRSFLLEKRVAIFIALFLMVLLVFGNRILIPDTYTATAMISVQVPETENIIVSEELLASSVLKEVIKKMDLTSPGIKQTGIQTILSSIGVNTERKYYHEDSVMRDIRTEVNIVSLGQTQEYATRTRQNPVFVLEVKDKDPEYVSALLNTILETFIEMKNSGKLETTIQQIDVLETEIKKIDEGIVESDQEMVEFRNSHPEYLPEEALNVELNTLRQQLTAAYALKTEEETKFLLLKGQLQNIPKTIPTSPGNFNGNTAVLSVQEQLNIKINELAAMKARYKPGNPKLAAIKSEIAVLENALKTDKTHNTGVSNPEYLTTQTAMTVSQSLSASANKQIEILSKRISLLEGKLVASPAIAKEIKNIEDAKTDLLTKRTDLTERLSQQKIVLQGASSKLTEFNVIQKAETPETPNIRSRLVIYIACVFASIFAGVMLATLYGMLTKVTEKEVVKHGIFQTVVFYASAFIIFSAVVVFIGYEFISQSLIIT